MKRNLWVTLAAAAAVFAAIALAASSGYKVVDKIKVGGTGGWDYPFVDSSAGLLYLSHTNQTEVVDLATGKVLGDIPETTGVHGIAIAANGHGYISAGRANAVVIFDTKTLATVGKIEDTGKNPDAILYEPASKRVITFNGTSKDASIIDTATDKVVATIPVGGKPEFAQADGKGHAYFNIEDTAEILEMDVAKASITKRISIKPCEGPSGLAMDTAKRRLFAVCGNKMMAVVDPDKGAVLATPEIGQGPDGVAFDSGMAFSANGRDGTITVVAETSPGKFEPIDTVATAAGARTIAADPKTHRLYLPNAENGPPPEGKKGRGAIIPDTFHVVVVGK